MFKIIIVIKLIVSDLKLLINLNYETLSLTHTCTQLSIYLLFTDIECLRENIIWLNMNHITIYEWLLLFKSELRWQNAVTREGDVVSNCQWSKCSMWQRRWSHLQIRRSSQCLNEMRINVRVHNVLHVFEWGFSIYPFVWWLEEILIFSPCLSEKFYDAFSEYVCCMLVHMGH